MTDVTITFVGDPYWWAWHPDEMRQAIERADPERPAREVAGEWGGTVVASASVPPPPPPEVTLTFVDPTWWSQHPDTLRQAMEWTEGGRPQFELRSGPADPPEERLVYSINEVAERLGISRSHAYESVQRGELPHIKLGARILIPKAALDRMLEASAPDG